MRREGGGSEDNDDEYEIVEVNDVNNSSSSRSRSSKQWFMPVQKKNQLQSTPIPDPSFNDIDQSIRNVVTDTVLGLVTGTAAGVKNFTVWRKTVVVAPNRGSYTPALGEAVDKFRANEIALSLQTFGFSSYLNLQLMRIPKVGGRISVQFEKSELFSAVVHSIIPVDGDPDLCDLVVIYEDDEIEEIRWPDAEIVLVDYTAVNVIDFKKMAQRRIETRGRCVEESCGQWSSKGSVFCARHDDDEDEDEGEEGGGEGGGAKKKALEHILTTDPEFPGFKTSVLKRKLAAITTTATPTLTKILGRATEEVEAPASVNPQPTNTIIDHRLVKVNDGNNNNDNSSKIDLDEFDDFAPKMFEDENEDEEDEDEDEEEEEEEEDEDEENGEEEDKNAPTIPSHFHNFRFGCDGCEALYRQQNFLVSEKDVILRCEGCK